MTTGMTSKGPYTRYGAGGSSGYNSSSTREGYNGYGQSYGTGYGGEPTYGGSGVSYSAPAPGGYVQQGYNQNAGASEGFGPNPAQVGELLFHDLNQCNQ